MDEFIANSRALGRVVRVGKRAWPLTRLAELGIRYLGPIDGHDIRGLISGTDTPQSTQASSSLQAEAHLRPRMLRELSTTNTNRRPGAWMPKNSAWPAGCSPTASPPRPAPSRAARGSGRADPQRPRSRRCREASARGPAARRSRRTPGPAPAPLSTRQPAAPGSIRRGPSTCCSWPGS